jgi:restriction endonuclease Mrr
VPYFIAIDREEQLILLLALYVLDKIDSRPLKKIQALRFVKARGLMKFYDDDNALRENGEPKWMNDLSWAREDLKVRGLLSMPEVGIWKLTDAGRSFVEAKAKDWVAINDERPASQTDFLKRCRRINEYCFLHMIMLGRGQDIRKSPARPPEISTS